MKTETAFSPAYAEAMSAAGLWPGITLLDCLEKACSERGDHAAIVTYMASAAQRSDCTYAKLNGLSLRIAANLLKLGVRGGDVVSLQLPNWWQFVAVHLACLRIGAITNPLMPIFREMELEFMLGFAQSKVLIVPKRFRDYDHEALAWKLQKKIPTLAHVFAVGVDCPATFEEVLLCRNDEESQAIASLAAPARPDDVIQILYTSGTTGEPKGVMHTSNTLFSNLVPYAKRLRLDEGTVVLMASPLAHQTGFMYGMMLPIYLRCTAVLQDAWKADVATGIVERERVTYTMASTPFLADMTEEAAQRPAAFDSLRTFHAACATIPRALVRSASDQLGAQVISGWGMTENGAVCTTRPEDRPEKIFETDGCPMEGMEIRVTGEDGRVLSAGESGDLQVRGCSNFVGYLRKPEAYATDAEGWFATGDVARIDQDGYLRITGRTKDILIRGGENIPIVEIENLLFRHPKIKEIAIVGRRDERLGERASAWVVPRPGESLELADLTTYLAEIGVSKTYHPEFLRVTDELPKTPSGKVQKFRLRERETALDLQGKS